MVTSTTVALPSFEQAIAQYDPVMGLEVHVELGTTTKLFCGCSTEFGAEPNAQVCPVCLGLPGSLPVLNRAAVESAIRLGLALNCTIAEWCRFARKNYFYPDMPKNFQISQYDEPIAYEGWLDITYEATTYRIGIERAHMEEDTGKSLHVGGTTGRIHGASYSLLDYNRSGIPLIEVVTKPIEVPPSLAPAISRAYVTELRELVRVLGISAARMELGQLRCDANVSLKPTGSTRFGTRTETKNVNSLRSVERAVVYEIRRQAAVLAEGGRVVQETRHWHEDTGETTSGRSKAQAEDYRYFPEPDLVPLAPSRDWVDALRMTLPELPSVSLARLQGEWGFSDLEMRDVLNAGAVELVAATVAAGSDAAGAKKWWLGEIARLANERGVALDAVGITPADVARIQELVGAGTLNDKLARQVIEGIVAGEGSSDDVVSARGLAVVSDEEALAAAVDAAIAAMPEVAAKVRAGNLAAVGPLVGAVMKATRGQANAARVRELILERLS
ncbi:MAG TPA: Asp-tRNA(Asn)/Glu-tRNA(Gln) amidotransferase subunit GatB [Jiangellaceae bacterium]|nr:Asp-tRNA(Asn)/Glu-tRNA(Gln) amidotransferase subunit GatB [Jiangellaceae bacterium]